MERDGQGQVLPGMESESQGLARQGPGPLALALAEDDPALRLQVILSRSQPRSAAARRTIAQIRSGSWQSSIRWIASQVSWAAARS